MTKTYFTTSELADRWRVNPRAIQTWVRHGALDAIDNATGHLVHAHQAANFEAIFAHVIDRAQRQELDRRARVEIRRSQLILDLGLPRDVRY